MIPVWLIRPQRITAISLHRCATPRPSLPTRARPRGAQGVHPAARAAAAGLVVMSGILWLTPAHAVCPDIVCYISNDRGQHIMNRHCSGACNAEKGKFRPSLCQSLFDLVDMCRSIKYSQTCNESVNNNERVVGTANFYPNKIGRRRGHPCPYAYKATVVYYKNANPPRVWTMYPGSPAPEDLQELNHEPPPAK